MSLREKGRSKHHSLGLLSKKRREKLNLMESREGKLSSLLR
jgi:hypothetical protein